MLPHKGACCAIERNQATIWPQVDSSVGANGRRVERGAARCVAPPEGARSAVEGINVAVLGAENHSRLAGAERGGGVDGAAGRKAPAQGACRAVQGIHATVRGAHKNRAIRTKRSGG